MLGFIASTGDRDLMRVETSRGSEQTISTTKYEVTGRGGKGRELLQRGQFTRVIPGEVENPQPLDGRRATAAISALRTTGVRLAIGRLRAVYVPDSSRGLRRRCGRFHSALKAP